MFIVLFATVFLGAVSGFGWALIEVYRQDESIRQAITIHRGNNISACVVYGNSTYNFRLPYTDFSVGLSDTTIRLLVEEAVVRAVNANKSSKEKTEHHFLITSEYANEANRFHARRIMDG